MNERILFFRDKNKMLNVFFIEQRDSCIRTSAQRYLAWDNSYDIIAVYSNVDLANIEFKKLKGT